MVDDENAGAPAEQSEPDNGREDRADEKDEKNDGDRPGGDRSQQFAEAMADPLAEAVGSSASQSMEQAYRTRIRTVQGSATVITGGTFGPGSIGATFIYGADHRQQASGPVGREVLAELAECYAPVPGFGALLKRLETDHLLVLRGAPGTGRASTALRLLDAVSPEGVARFSAETDLRALPDSALESGFGYLHELIPGWGAITPEASHVDRLRKQLSDQGCFMVVAIPHDRRYRTAFEAYAATCPLPDPEAVLHRAIDYETKRRPELAPDLEHLAGAQRIGETGKPLPSEARWNVALLVSHAAGEITAKEMEERRQECLVRLASDWFEPLANIPPSSAADEQVRLATFRIALAVFNRTPFDLVAEAGELLAWEILTAASPKRVRGRAVFANHREDYLADSLAHDYADRTSFGKSSAPAIFAEYLDQRMPLAILRHVWDVHNIRGPMISWLQKLSQDKRPFVFMGAALAMGVLASFDFSYSFHQLIDPWAESRDPQSRNRLVAAIALDAASVNSDVLPVVQEIVDDWCRKGNAEQRWTGATALGYDLGMRDIDKSLRSLRTVGCGGEMRLAAQASWAVARIFARGGIEAVLDAVAGWLADDRRPVRDFGLWVVMRIADLKAGSADADLASAARHVSAERLADRADWPLVVALADENPKLLDPLVDVLWKATQVASAQEQSLAVLGRWIRTCAKDSSCIGAVGRFLALLGDSETDRDRLVYLIGVLRSDRDEPLSGEIADRLVTTIKTNVDPAGKEG
jgi:hypothetical protein